MNKEELYKAIDVLKAAGIPHAKVRGETSFNEVENKLYILGGFVTEEPESFAYIRIIHEAFMIHDIDGQINATVFAHAQDEESVITVTLDSAVDFVIDAYKKRKPAI